MTQLPRRLLLGLLLALFLLLGTQFPLVLDARLEVLDVFLQDVAVLCTGDAHCLCTHNSLHHATRCYFLCQAVTRRE